LKLRKVEGYWNYDKSEFDKPSPIKDNDDDIEAIWKTQYSLKEFTAPTNFKTYDELKTRLGTVLAGKTSVGNVTTFIDPADEPTATVTVDTKEEPAPTVTVSSDEEDDTLSYFEKLADKG